MISKKVSEPYESNKINSHKHNDATNNKCYFDLLYDSNSNEDYCYSQKHIFYGNWAYITVLIIVDIK